MAQQLLKPSSRHGVCFDGLLNPLLMRISECFDSGEYSDLEVRCKNGEVHKVHKLVLCAQSGVFKRALDMRHNFREAVEGVICLDEDDPKIIRALLEYLYRLDYAVPEYSDMLFHAKVYAIGEVYDVQGIKTLAMERFQSLGQVGWNSPAFSNTAREVYETTPDGDRGLRDSVVRIAAEHVHELLEKEDFQKTVEEIGAFGKDLLCAGLKSPVVWKEEAERIARRTLARYGRYICPSCKREVEMVLPDEGRGRCRCLRCGKKCKDWEKYQIDLRIWEDKAREQSSLHFIM